MPYIKQEHRRGARLDPQSPGELNFAITELITTYLGPEPCYGGINAVIGVLECAKMELYRRIAVPYEDQKCEENGDVY